MPLIRNVNTNLTDGGSSTRVSSSGATHGGAGITFGTKTSTSQGFNQSNLGLLKSAYGKNGTSVLGQNRQVDTPSYSSGSYGYAPGSGDSGSDYYADLWDTFQKQSEAARDAAINAIMKNLESVRSAYNGQITAVGNDYDRQIDENELRKERARRVTRENQANRGQLESGLGRQELLNQNVGYDKITSNLKSARAKAINDIYNLITQAEAEAESGKANINNNYANSLLQFRLANM